MWLNKGNLRERTTGKGSGYYKGEGKLEWLVKEGWNRVNGDGEWLGK